MADALSESQPVLLRPQHTCRRKCDDKPRAAIFQRVADQHGRHRKLLATAALIGLTAATVLAQTTAPGTRDGRRFYPLAGVAAETGVVMLIYLDHALAEVRQQRLVEGLALSRADLRRAIMASAVERVRPKMMTVVAIVAGLVPILWSTGTGPRSWGASPCQWWEEWSLPQS